MTANPAAAANAEPHGVWTYAVTEQIPAGCLSDVTGVSGEPVRAVAAAGLTAVAGDVRLAEFGEAALRRNLEDLDWLGQTARAHHRVIDAVARYGPVVPMRLATVYSDDPNLTAVLEQREADFRTALARTAGRREWGVKVYAARPEPPAAGQARAGEEAGRERPGSGVEYLRRKRQELTTRQDDRRASLMSVEAIHAQLCQLSAEARLHPPQPPELAGVSAPMLLNGAYLLDAGQDDDFTSAVTALARQHPAIQVELTGPWPPYSFTGLAPAGEA